MRINRKRLEQACVQAFDNHHPRVLAKPPMQEPATDVDRIDARRSTPKEHVREAAGGRADVSANAARGIDPKLVESWRKLEGAATRIVGRRIDRDGRIVAHRSIGPSDRLTSHAHLSRKDQSLGALA